MTRLETISSDLAGQLQHASSAKQREASFVACEFAVTHAGVEDAVVQVSLRELRLGNALTTPDRENLQDLTNRLDDEYLDLKEAAEAGRANPDACLRPFAQARAVSAVLSAFKGDSLEASSEAIYEALAATDNQAMLFSLITATLQ